MRSSGYGYGSYSSRGYGSGNYYRRNRRNNNNNKGLIIALICVAVVGVGVGVCALTGVFDPFLKKGIAEESSTAESAQSVAEVSDESRTGKQESSKTAESSAESSAETSKPKEVTGKFDGNVFICDNKGYQIFYGTESVADKYSKTVRSIKSSLGKGVNVYDMTVPVHSLYGLPEKYQDLGSDQKAVLSHIYSSMGDDIRTIDVTETLGKHKDEYIYFGTDHNWTALGAYYAYCDFCKAAGVAAVDIKKLSTGSITEFEGSLTAATMTDKNPKGNKTLLRHPDTVTYYNIPGEHTCTLLENGKSSPEEVSLLATFAQGSNAYSAFIWGNNPYMHIKTGLKTGRKLCIIKDSYGCAFAPFTVTNFDEVYIVDPGYYDGNVLDYIKKNKYTDVLVLNSIMTASTEIRIKELKTVLD